MATQWTLTTLATNATDGPIIGALDLAGWTSLAYDYAFNYPAFITRAQSLVNQSVLSIEADLPEGTPVQLELTNLRGPLGGSVAGQLATAITQAWAQGKLVNIDGTTLTPWPGSSAIVYQVNDTTATLTLRWVKLQPSLWIVIAALAVITAFAVYLAIRESGYTMSSASASTSTSSVIPNPIPWLLRNWFLIPVTAGVLVAAPFVVRHVRETEEAEHA